MPQVEAPDQVNGDKPGIFTMRQLNQQTAFVMDQIEKSGRPALISRSGRFVARITPIQPEVEERVLSETALDIGKQEPSASPQVNNDKPDVYTVHKLGQNTAFVMEQIRKNGPALITRNGHFVAVITALSGDVESSVLAAMARDIGKREPGASSQTPP
jgi:antitoxin (DNA-binding transcriptional repressor) of toxin-antitoxin stability system